MVKITKQDVLYISKLARIELREDEIKKYEKELTSILDFVSELQKVNTENVQPLSSIIGVKNIVRDDTISNNNQREYLLKNTPKTKNGSIVTNKVLGTESSA